MARPSRAILQFGAPLAALGLTALAAWLAMSRSETLLGPMRLEPLPAASSADPDAPPPTTLAPISPLEAELRNALLPYSHTPLSPGARFNASADVAAGALTCLTAAVYYEAGREPLPGRRAVAQVILNRAATAPFPRTVCGVVQQGASRPGCQFTFMCDGSLGHRPEPNAWAASREVAQAALNGYVETSVGAATHYHADYVFPTWAPTMLKLVKIGRHVFYRWPHASLATTPFPEPLAPPEGAISADAALSGISSAVEAPRGASAPGSPPASTAAPGPAATPAVPEVARPSEPAADPSPVKPAPSPAPPLRPALPPHRAVPERNLRIGPI